MSKVANHVVRTSAQRQSLLMSLTNRPAPFTVSITDGEPRTLAQNRMQRQWFRDAEQQGDQTAEEYRGYCKLHFGVPILRAENEAFVEAYDRTVKPLPYETKLALMQEPIDLPITRIMTVDQLSRYLDAVQQHLTGLGFLLTDPGEPAVIRASA